MSALCLYAGYRMTVRSAPSVDETSSYAPVSAAASPVAWETAVQVIEEAEEIASANES